ncbi:unnamed protein product [Closterium sp. NIES-54]
MALLRVLAFDHESRSVQFDTWLDDLQLYLLSDSKDSVSLFDLTSGAATGPPAIVVSATRSQLLTRDVAARLAIRNHLPLAEYAHFGQHKTAQALYDGVVTRYSSPATAALGRLLLPYLFPKLSAFATVEDLVSHLRTNDARYRDTILAEFLDRNQPPMFITLYFIVTRLPESLRSVRDHFLSLDPTSLTVDLLKQHLLAAETSAVVVGAARGTPRPPFFEGCSPSPLAPSYAFAAAADVSVAEDVEAASASAKRRSSKGKVGRGVGGGSGGGGGGSGSGGGGSTGGGGGSGTGGGSGGSGGGGGGSGESGGSGGDGTGGGRTGPRCGGPGGGQRQQQQRRSETQSPQQLREWLFQRGTSGGSDSCPYVIRTGDHAGQTCGKIHTQHRCLGLLRLESGGAEPGGEEPGVEPGGAESEDAESRVAEPRGVASSGAIEAGGAGDAGAGGAGVTAGAGGIGGTTAAGPGGACARGAGAAGTGGVGGAGAGDPTEPGAAGAGDSCAGGAGAGGAGAGGPGVGGTGAGGAGAAGAGAVDP